MDFFFFYVKWIIKFQFELFVASFMSFVTQSEIFVTFFIKIDQNEN